MGKPALDLLRMSPSGRRVAQVHPRTEDGNQRATQGIDRVGIALGRPRVDDLGERTGTRPAQQGLDGPAGGFLVAPAAPGGSTLHLKESEGFDPAVGSLVRRPFHGDDRHRIDLDRRRTTGVLGRRPGVHRPGGEHQQDKDGATGHGSSASLNSCSV